MMIGSGIYSVRGNHLELNDYPFALDRFFKDKRQQMQAIYQGMTQVTEDDPDLKALYQDMLQKRNISLQAVPPVDTILNYHIEDSIEAVENDFDEFYSNLPDSAAYKDAKERQVEIAKNLFKNTICQLKGEPRRRLIRSLGA